MLAPPPTDEPRAASTRSGGRRCAWSRQKSPVELAITGIGARVGPLEDRYGFRQAVLLGQSALQDRPEGRWGQAEASQWLQHQPIDRRPNVGAWLPGLALPVGRFKIPPMEAAKSQGDDGENTLVFSNQVYKDYELMASMKSPITLPQSLSATPGYSISKKTLKS